MSKYHIISTYLRKIFISRDFASKLENYDKKTLII